MLEMKRILWILPRIALPPLSFTEALACVSAQSPFTSPPALLLEKERDDCIYSDSPYI
jgi:hypothetical protein